MPESRRYAASPRLVLLVTVLASVLTAALVAGLLGFSAARAEVAPVAVDLATASAYSALGASALTNDGPSTFSGSVGVSPNNEFTGMHKAVFVGGTQDVNNAKAIQAHTDAVAAYQQIRALAPTATIADDLAGRTITPGVYYAAAALAMTTELTFDAGGDPNAYFIFQINAGLNTTAGTTMLLKGGAQASHIFWQVAAGTVIGGTSTFLGTVLSYAEATAGSTVDLDGRLISITAAVTVTNIHMTGVPAFSDPVADTATTRQATAVSFNVLQNDGSVATGATFSRTQLSTTPQLIGQAAGPTPASPRYGSVTCLDSGTERGTCSYQPIASFIGVDGFDYSLAKSGRTFNVHVTITVTAESTATVIRADRVVATSAGTTVVFNPLANDSPGIDSAAVNAATPNAEGVIVAADVTALAITAVSELTPAEGQITCDATSCRYVPPTSTFTGVTRATYSVSTTPGSAELLTGSITISVDPTPLVTRGFSAAASSAPTVALAGLGTPLAPTAVVSCTDKRPATTVRWLPNADGAPHNTTWVLERRVAVTTPGTWVGVAVLPASTTSFTDYLVGEGQTYQWRLRPDLNLWQGTFSPASLATSQPDATSAVGCG